MNPATEHLEGKLLDYAYGELEEGEAKTVEAHLRACSQCTESLTAMKQVRRAMSQLPIAPAPQAGLESLMAYAQKAAGSARARPLRGRRWLRWIAPLATAAALSVVLVVSSKVMRRPDASSVVLGDKDARGDWESPPQVAAKKADAPPKAEKALAKRTAGLRQAQTRAKETDTPATAEPTSEWATPPKDWKGSDVPAAGEPAAPPPERIAKSADRLRADEGEVGRKAKATALKAAPAPAAEDDKAAAAGEELQAGATRRLAREGAPEGGMPDGVVGGVAGGVPAGPGKSNSAEKQPSGEGGLKSGVANSMRGVPSGASGARSQAQQPPAGVGSPHTDFRAESKPAAPSASEARSLATRAPAESTADREREVARLQQALANGAQGEERARLLRQLCEELDALGRTRDADSACDTVVREFPASEQAKSALDRLKARAAERR